MQAATSPFSSSLPHPHYHGYYQIQPPGIELKRQYLSLLPPQQIIEICLTFDAYVPPYAKITIWPSDLNAAIAGLQKPSLSENSVPNETSDDGPDNVNSQRAQELEPDITGAVDPRPPDREDSSTPVPLPDSPSTESSIPVQNPCSKSPSDPPSGSAAEPVQSATTPTIQGQASQSLQTVQTTQPVPPQLYGYGHPQAAYPHTPYYPPGYPYPYVYPSPQHGFPPPPAYPPHPTPYGSMVPPPPPPHPLPEALGTDDLPSYEEMIVEALTESTDPEGSAPKDLFTWMAARYPLQSNFRPSASQALQKAFKRGRFEKSSNGKYRLNATWEGGNTSRRTTRRPQTQNHASSGPANRTSGSPFTHAPLVHHHQHHPPRVVAAPHSGQPPYPAHPYGYSGYPPYGSHQPQASTSKAPGANVEPALSVKNSSEGATSSGDSAAAYEAAQSILKAINFGGLLKLPPDEQNEQKQGAPQAVGNGVEQLLSHVQAILAAENTEEATVGSSAQSSGSSLLPSVPALHASAETRAELQAQLALLSAQLAELAQTEQSEAMVPLSGSQPIMHSLVADTSTNTTMTSNSTSQSALPTIGTSVEGGVESDEDDMEEII